MNALTLLMQVLACRLGVVTGLGIFFLCTDTDILL